MKLDIPSIIVVVLIAVSAYYLGTLGKTSEVAEIEVKLLESELASLQTQLLEAKRDRRKLATDKAMAESALAAVREQDPTVAEHLVEDLLRRTDPEYLNIREEWLQLTNVLRKERDQARDESRSPNRRLETELDDLDQELILRRAAAREELTQQIQAESLHSAQKALNQIQASLSVTDQHIEDLQTQLSDVSQRPLIATTE